MKFDWQEEARTQGFRALETEGISWTKVEIGIKAMHKEREQGWGWECGDRQERWTQSGEDSDVGSVSLSVPAFFLLCFCSWGGGSWSTRVFTSLTSLDGLFCTTLISFSLYTFDIKMSFIFTLFVVQTYNNNADKIYFHNKKPCIFTSFLPP